MVKELKLNIYAWFSICLGTLFWSITMIKSGLCWDAKCLSGLGFWGANGHDGIWHISLINSLARGSWGIPVFAGETIRNYHIGFDLFVAIIHKISFIPVSVLYFQVLPPIFTFLIGFFCYKFVYAWRKSNIQALISTFFVYFGGSWGWVITLIKEGRFGGESMFWAQQSISTLVNPPFALSLLIIFAGLWLLIEGVEKNNRKLLTLATFLFGVLVQVKVYAGLLILVGIFAAGFWRVIGKRKFDLMKVAIGSLVISILVFSPVSKNVGQTIVFKPFWFLETMMAVSDRVNWPKFYEAMINYRFGHIWIKAIAFYSIAFLIFLLGNMGTRLIGVFWFFRKEISRKYNFVDIALLVMTVAGIIAPTFFVQTGTPWNTIQFIYYSLMFSGVFAGVFLGNLLEKSNIIKRFVVLAIIIILTLPTTIGTIWYHYLPSRPPAKISLEELDALRFLSSQPDGVVLTYPFDRLAAKKAESDPPRPLYLYESTAYVSAYSKKSVFLEDEVNLDITGYNWKERRFEIENFLQSLDHQYVGDFLRNNNISYVYWIKGQRARLGEGQIGMTKIFENKLVDIYKTDGVKSYADLIK